MAENDKENKEKSGHPTFNEQSDETKETFAKNTTRNPSQGHQIHKDDDNKDYREKLDTKFEQSEQNKLQKEIDSDSQNILEQDIEAQNEHKIDSDIHKPCPIALNSFKMRRKIIEMEVNIIKTYILKLLIEKDHDTENKLSNIETHFNKINSNLDIDDITMPSNDLLKAESLCTEIMKNIKLENKNRRKAKEAFTSTDSVFSTVDDKEVPDYRSIVTVRGTPEDVSNCIVKARAAFDKGKYDRAENLLLKAERMIPTKNARSLLIEVIAAKEQQQNTKPIQKTTESKQALKDETKSNLNTVNCVADSEEVFTSGNGDKIEIFENSNTASVNIEETIEETNTDHEENITKERSDKTNEDDDTGKLNKSESTYI